MRSLISTVAGVCLLASTAAHAAVFVKIGDIMHTLDDQKYGRMTVCQFKDVVARLGELDTPEKFTLMMGGRDLPGDATLISLGFEKDISIVVGKMGKDSRQCGSRR